VVRDKSRSSVTTDLVLDDFLSTLMFTARVSQLSQRRLSLLAAKVASFAPPPYAEAVAHSGRRFQSTAPEPPAAGGHLPSIATSTHLRTTRDAALRSQSIEWVDGDDNGPPDSVIAGRETRKMNLYQAVRDAMGYVAVIVLRVNPDWL
jgi:hypothetical protein